jgi:hypothetical protein
MPEYIPKVKITAQSPDQFAPTSTLVPEVLVDLIRREREMRTDCTDPLKWEELAKEYEAVKYSANAERCKKKAQHFRDVKAGLRT